MKFKSKSEKEKFLEETGVTKLYKDKYQEALDTIAEKDKKITELEATVNKLKYLAYKRVMIELEGEDK